MRTLTRALRSLPVVVAAFAVLALTGIGMAAQPGGHSPDKIVVSGASGQLGGLVVRELLARGVPASNLILVSRTPEKLDEFKKMGASTRFGDFGKPESLTAAFAGGKKLLLISIGFGGGPRPEAHQHAIDAAVAAGIDRIVYTSYVSISQGDNTGLAGDHFQTEERIRKSGVAWTMLRNSIYSNGLVQQGAKMLADGKATVGAADARIGYVTREDCAAAAAAVLTSKSHENPRVRHHRPRAHRTAGDCRRGERGRRQAHRIGCARSKRACAPRVRRSVHRRGQRRRCETHRAAGHECARVVRCAPQRAAWQREVGPRSAKAEFGNSKGSDSCLRLARIRGRQFSDAAGSSEGYPLGRVGVQWQLFFGVRRNPSRILRGGRLPEQ